MAIPRAEHPNPQWERKNWINLNGEWEFDFDFGKSAKEKKLYQKGALPKKITVPFAPESKLSGIGYTDFISAVCYRKVINLSAENVLKNVFLHFGAVDFHSYIYINGEFAGEHIGGYASFKIDVTKFVKEGENVIFVIAEDDVRSVRQPSGKQSDEYNSYGCFYTRTTGIWQTVWLEFVPKTYIKNCKYYPNIESGTLLISGETVGGGELEISSFYEGKPTGKTTVKTRGGFFTAQLALSELHLWEIGCGRLYDLELKLGQDVVKSYFGMREFRLEGNKFKLNDKSVFLRTVLDQGFYPDGIYTAATDDVLKRDIEISMALGFDGARLHQKIFEKRFLYHCDKAGYIVWGEYPNWGVDYNDAVAQGNFICEWAEALERDFNSPALIGWCPFNETWGYKENQSKHRIIESVYKLTKAFDSTRPCIDTSGNYHILPKEIHDVHDYLQDTKKFAENYANIASGIVIDQIERLEGGANYTVQPYHGEPIYVSEYGGIKNAPNGNDGWGYGDAPKTEKEFIERYRSLTETLISNPHIAGLCYTQLYDVEQEQNGLYNYDRSAKFNEEVIKTLKAVMQKKAAIED